MECIYDRLGEGAALGEPMGRRLPTCALLNGIEVGYSTQGFGRDGRARGLGHLIEFAPCVAPTRGEYDIASAGDALKSSVAIDVQTALEVREVRHRPLGFAIWRKQVDRRRRFRAAPTPLFASIDPKTAGLGSSSSRIEHGYRRVVGKEVVRGKHVPAQPFVQGFEPPARTADPAGERRTTEIDAVSCEDLRLPIERGVIAIFADQDLRQKRRRCQPAGDRAFRCGSLGNGAATPARVFGSRRADHAKLRWYPVQHLADALADHMQRPTAAAAHVTFDVEANVVSWQMVGEWLASRRCVARLPNGWRLALLSAANIRVDIFQAKSELIRAQTLGSSSVLRSLQLFDDRLEAFDLAILVLDRRNDIADQMMQRCCVRWQIAEIELHVRFYSNMLI